MNEKSSKGKKARDLGIVALIYVLAFAIGIAACYYFPKNWTIPFLTGEMTVYFLFDLVATIVTFIFSTILKNSSVYDAYWSLTPMVMSIWLFVCNRAFSPWQMAVLLVFNIWSLRLTLNWVSVFSDFSYEDWRYRMFREITPPIFWPIVNFIGIHFMPTVIVFAGMLPLFEASHRFLGPWSIPGMLVIILGVAFELFADKAMHRFLKGAKAGEVCAIGLWKYSRHPNYLGEITVWLGVYLTMLPYAPDRWYYGAGFVLVAIMFEVISIPMMEKRQLARRPEYASYKKRTSRLLLLPIRK